MSFRASLASFFSSAPSSFNESEDELLFEEMDLILREEINRLEQALTDYLQAQIGSRINRKLRLKGKLPTPNSFWGRNTFDSLPTQGVESKTSIFWEGPGPPMLPYLDRACEKVFTNLDLQF